MLSASAMKRRSRSASRVASAGTISLGRFGVDEAEEASDRCGASADAELGVHVLEVLTNRARRKPEPAGDLGVRLPKGHQAQHLAFARSQHDLFLSLLEQKVAVRSRHRQLPPPAASNQGPLPIALEPL